jgi:signal transduction histidine kinase
MRRTTMDERAPQTVFIADDNPENLQVLSDLLESEGYEIRASLSGDEMLQSVEYQLPDLIILDVHMPERDGYEICHELKASEATRDIPVLFCSALDEPYNIVKGFEVGGVDYITKPFRNREVLARVRTHMELREKQAALERNLEYLKNAQQHLIETEKMASIGVFTSGIAHEINNPINYIINSLEGLRRDYADITRILDYCTAHEDAQGDSAGGFAGNLRSLLDEIEYPSVQEEMEQLLDGIYSGALKVHEIVKSLRAFSTSDDEPQQAVDVPTEMDRAILMVGHKLNEHVEIGRSVENSATVTAQPGQLSQVVLQLLENSLDAIENAPEREQHRILISVQSDPAGSNQVLLQVADDGCGMSQETLRYARVPFYTAKEVGHGTGLGLTTVEHIVGDLNGTLDISSSLGEGTTVSIHLPVSDDPVA